MQVNTALPNFRSDLCVGADSHATFYAREESFAFLKKTLG
jgi:hypothetical protein